MGTTTGPHNGFSVFLGIISMKKLNKLNRPMLFPNPTNVHILSLSKGLPSKILKFCKCAENYQCLLRPTSLDGSL